MAWLACVSARSRFAAQNKVLYLYKQMRAIFCEALFPHFVAPPPQPPAPPRHPLPTFFSPPPPFSPHSPAAVSGPDESPQITQIPRTHPAPSHPCDPRHPWSIPRLSLLRALCVSAPLRATSPHPVGSRVNIAPRRRGAGAQTLKATVHVLPSDPWRRRHRVPPGLPVTSPSPSPPTTPNHES